MKTIKPKLMKRKSQEGDELWLVSYADMVTLLLGLFVILYSFSTIDSTKLSAVSDNISSALGKSEKEKARKESKEKIVSKEKRKIQALSMMVNMVGQGNMESFVKDMENIEKRKQKAEVVRNILAQEALNKESNLLEIVIPSQFLFASGSTTIPAATLKQLAPIAKKIKSLENLVEVDIEGHSDATPISTGPYPSNWALSAARAGSVAQALIKHGVKPNLLKPHGLSSTRPLFPEKNSQGIPIYENRAKNRRVHIKLRVK